MQPIVDGLEQAYSDEIAFKRINADKDDGPKIIKAYNILGHPTVLLIADDGRELARFVGPQSTETLKAALGTQFGLSN